MEKNDTINFVFLFLCALLLGFVYMNNRMLDESARPKKAAVEISVEAEK